MAFLYILKQAFAKPKFTTAMLFLAHITQGYKYKYLIFVKLG